MELIRDEYFVGLVGVTFGQNISPLQSLRDEPEDVKDRYDALIRFVGSSHVCRGYLSAIGSHPTLGQADPERDNGTTDKCSCNRAACRYLREHNPRIQLVECCSKPHYAHEFPA